MSGKVYLLTTDGSENARQAEEYVSNLANPNDSVVVLSVVRGSAAPVFPSALVQPTHEDAILSLLRKKQAEMQHIVDSAVERLSSKVSSVGRLVHGEAKDEILKTADDVNADFIVLGARGLSTVQRLLLGSVSTHVLHNARQAVIIVKGSSLGRPRRYLCAIDESLPSKHALETLLQVAKPDENVGILAVHVPFVSLEDDLAAWMGDEESRNARCAAALLELEKSYVPVCEAANVRCTAMFRQGDPRTVICEECDANEVDMLVMGARGAGMLERFFLGSVSSYCTHNAKVNAVMVVKVAPRAKDKAA